MVEVGGSQVHELQLRLWILFRFTKHKSALGLQSQGPFSVDSSHSASSCGLHLARDSANLRLRGSLLFKCPGCCIWRALLN